MMRISKFFYLLLVVMMTGVMVSCGDDDDDPAGLNGGGGGSVTTPTSVSVDKLMGKWEFVDGDETLSMSGQGMNMNDTRITFDRSTVTQYAQQAGVGIWDLTLVFTETTVNGQPYKLTGNVLMDQSSDEGSVKVTVKSVTDADLYLYEVISIAENGMNINIKATLHYRKSV